MSLDNGNEEEIFNAVKLLIDNGADINVANQQGVTPILSLLKLKRVHNREPIIQLLLDQSTINLDTHREQEARKLLEKNFPHLKLPIPSTVLDVNFEQLVELLDNGEDNKFCTSFLVKFNQNPKIVYDNHHSRGSLLQIAVENGVPKSVRLLVESGSNINAGDRKCPVKLACYHGEWEILDYLLKSEHLQVNFVKDDPVLCIIVKKLGEEEVRKTCDYYKCFKLLLSDRRIDVNEIDSIGSSALHYAVRYKNEWACDMLLQKSAFIGLENRFKDIPILDIQSSILEKHFDSCVTVNDLRPGDNDFEIRFDYSSFVPAAVRQTKETVFDEEMVPIEYIAQNPELKHLVKHPLISSFLFLKWYRLGPLFYTNLVFYSFFCLSLLLYLVFCYGHDVSSETDMAVRCCAAIGVCYVIIREMFQFLTSPLGYFKNLENYIEMVLIVMSVVVLYGAQFEPSTRRILASVVILLIAVEFSVLVGALPIFSFSTHLVMLKTVSISLLRSLTFYSIIIISFGLCFYTLLGGGADPNAAIQAGATNATDFNKFENIHMAIIKTFVMMTGEFEAAEIEFYTNAISYLIFLLFVFFISIVLFNLLNGLAVSDTQAIKSEAELLGLISRAQLLSRFEKMVLRGENFCNQLILQNSVMSKMTKRRICLFPKLLPLNMIIVLPNNGNKINIPVTAELEEGKSNNLNKSQENLIGSAVSEIKILQRKQFPILKPLNCCLFNKSCSRMDTKVMKYSRHILSKKKEDADKFAEKKVLNERLSRLETKLDLLLKAIESKV